MANRRAPLPSDLSDVEWGVLQSLLPPPLPGGRQRTTDLREILNAAFYLTKNGCSWKALPHVSHRKAPSATTCTLGGAGGVWEPIKGSLPRQTRCRAGREEEPSAGIIDQLHGFVVLPRRWVVERTFGWIAQYRRLSKDYEFHLETSEAMIQMAMIHRVLRRLGTATQVARAA